MVILSVIVAILLFVLFAYLKYVDRGFMISKCFPYKPMKAGDKVHIYINNVYNRSATISQVSGRLLYIYIKLPLEIEYRGRFYATGVLGGGERLIFVPQHKYLYLAVLAEAVRKIFGITECIENLPIGDLSSNKDED